jgi:outer membrane lipoprotein LolB
LKIRFIQFLYGLSVVLLAGCAQQKIVPTQPPIAETDAPFSLNGRVSIKHHGERSTAGVNWLHRIGEDEILLLAPLGQTVARLHQNNQGVTLETSGQTHHAADAESLTQQVLGWTLPLSGLRYWVMALPASGSEADIQRSENGQISQLQQAGWKIHYSRYVSEDRNSLPLRIKLEREQLEILLLIDAWEKP